MAGKLVHAPVDRSSPIVAACRRGWLSVAAAVGAASIRCSRAVHGSRTPGRHAAESWSRRSERSPPTYNRLVDHSTAGEALALLTQAPLVYVNRATDTLEPWLAESWTESADHLTYTHQACAAGVTFSDGTPLTSADVLFTFRALYDPKVESPLAGDTLVNGKPLQVVSSRSLDRGHPAAVAVRARTAAD